MRTNKALVVKGALTAFLSPRLAADAQINLAPMLDGLTDKNFKERKPALIEALKSSTAGKLAKDAHINDVTGLLDALESHTEEEHGEGEEEDDKKKKTAKDQEATEGLKTGKTESEGSRKFLEGKLTAEDMAAYDKMCADDKAAKDAEAEMEKEKKDANDKQAMDAAITAGVSTAVTAAIEAERARNAAIRAAEKKVRPYIGEANLAMDSAESIYTQALGMLGVKQKLDGLPVAALEAILEAQPKPGASTRQSKTPIAFDAKVAGDISARFPTAHAHLPRQL